MAAKCTRLHVTKSKQVLDCDYKLHGQTLATVSSAKYICITIDKEASSDSHIDAITAKANKTLGFPRCNLKIRSMQLWEKAYLIFVRPLLEYASSVRCSTKKHINKIAYKEKLHISC